MVSFTTPDIASSGRLRKGLRKRESFALVAMFYMHLRYDARLFTVLFAGGLALGGLRSLRPDVPDQLLLGSEPARVSSISTREG